MQELWVIVHTEEVIKMVMKKGLRKVEKKDITKERVIIQDVCMLLLL